MLLLEDEPHPDRPGITVWKLLIAENERQDQRQAPSQRTDHGRDRAGRYEQTPPQQRQDAPTRARTAGRAVAGERDWTPDPLPPGGDDLPF